MSERREVKSLQTTAVIAAYNEEDSIGQVLASLKSSPLIDEIIVVSDGSTDRTVEIARSFDVRTIALRENRGKGCAMNVGVEHASHDLLFFVDGDMLNLTDEHIQSLILPVRDGQCDMNVGVRHRGTVLDFFHLRLHVGPVLSGIRVMLREVFDCVPSQYRQRFQIETALNYFSARAGFRQTNTVVRNLGHIIKESKRGILSGLSSRWDMSSEVFLVQCDLYLFQGWRWVPTEESPVAEYDLFEAELFD